MKRLLLIASLCLFAYSAQNINGDGTAVDYTQLGLSARYWGMGKTGVAHASDSGAILLNPASLGQMRSFETSLMSTKVLGEFNYLLWNGVIPLQNETVGWSLLHEDAGTIYSTDGVDQYGHPVQGDTIQNYNRVYSFGYGRKAFLDNLYIGTMVKAYQKKLSFVEAKSFAADIGAMYRWDKYMQFGVTVKNFMQSGLRYNNRTQDIEAYDTYYVTGVAWNLLDNNLLLAIDQQSNAKFGRTSFGAEYWIQDMVALRAGISESDLTMGAGFRYDVLQFDFGLRFQEAPLENQMLFSFTYGNARRSVLTKPEIEIVDEQAPAATTPGTKTPQKNSDGQEPQQIQVVD